MPTAQRLPLLAAMVGLFAAAFVAGPAGASENEEPIFCRPASAPDGEPLPLLMWNHGRVQQAAIYERAKQGWRIRCRQYADTFGAAVIIPLRGMKSGPENLPGELEFVDRALDAAKARTDIDKTRIVVMGHSRGALLSLMSAVRRSDIAALVMTAPPNIPPATRDAARNAKSLTMPALLMVEQSDDEGGLRGYEIIEDGLRSAGADHRAIFYKRGGGHMLFTRRDYWWDDLAVFLAEKAGFTPPRPN